MKHIVILLALLVIGTCLHAVDPWGEPLILSGSMTVMARVSINSASTSPGDVLAAFVSVDSEQQLRGKQAIAVNDGISGCLIQIFTETNGEEIHFCVWDESQQDSLLVAQPLWSVVNGMIGSWPDNLYQINAGDGILEVANPVFDPPSGIYDSPQMVSMSCATPGAEIRYTVDGSEPVMDGALYTGPIAVNFSGSVKAKAWLAGWTPSAVSTATYAITGACPAPVFSPPAGLYQAPQNVNISCPLPEAVIRYTLNGTEPHLGSPVYSGPISVSQNTQIKAKAWMVAWTPSPTVSSLYTITGTVATPVFGPLGGIYTSPLNVGLSCTTPGAQIRYTIDGSEPTESSALYTSFIYVSSSLTLRARAFKADWAPSQIASAIYTITGTVATPVIDTPGGIYTQPIQVILSCATPGATIRYTTNGNEPYTGSPTYTGPVTISASCILKAKAWLTGWNTSPTASATYTITGTVAAPAMDPPPGLFDNQVEVTISCPQAGTVIRYSLDGSVVEGNSTIYEGPVLINSTSTLKARAFKNNWLPSEQIEGVYEIALANPEHEQIPQLTCIQSAWPNPFSQRITIAVSLAEKDRDASLCVYNLKGQKVRDLKLDFTQQGEIHWDGCDHHGQKLPSGIYLLRLNGKTDVHTRKLVLKG